MAIYKEDKTAEFEIEDELLPSTKKIPKVESLLTSNSKISISTKNILKNFKLNDYNAKSVDDSKSVASVSGSMTSYNNSVINLNMNGNTTSSVGAVQANTETKTSGSSWMNNLNTKLDIPTSNSDSSIDKEISIDTANLILSNIQSYTLEDANTILSKVNTNLLELKSNNTDAEYIALCEDYLYNIEVFTKTYKDTIYTPYIIEILSLLNKITLARSKSSYKLSTKEPNDIASRLQSAQIYKSENDSDSIIKKNVATAINILSDTVKEYITNDPTMDSYVETGDTLDEEEAKSKLKEFIPFDSAEELIYEKNPNLNKEEIEKEYNEVIASTMEQERLYDNIIPTNQSDYGGVNSLAGTVNEDGVLNFEFNTEALDDANRLEYSNNTDNSFFSPDWDGNVCDSAKEVKTYAKVLYEKTYAITKVTEKFRAGNILNTYYNNSSLKKGIDKMNKTLELSEQWNDELSIMFNYTDNPANVQLNAVFAELQIVQGVIGNTIMDGLQFGTDTANYVKKFSDGLTDIGGDVDDIIRGFANAKPGFLGAGYLETGQNMLSSVNDILGSSIQMLEAVDGAIDMVGEVYNYVTDEIPAAANFIWDMGKNRYNELEKMFKEEATMDNLSKIPGHIIDSLKNIKIVQDTMLLFTRMWGYLKAIPDILRQIKMPHTIADVILILRLLMQVVKQVKESISQIQKVIAAIQNIYTAVKNGNYLQAVHLMNAGIIGTGTTVVQKIPKFAPRYPFNNARRTEGGMVLELDETPPDASGDLCARLAIEHPTGTRVEYATNGDLISKVKKDYQVVVDGEDSKIVEGNSANNIKKDYTLKAKTIHIEASDTLSISGQDVHFMNGGAVALSSPIVQISASVGTAQLIGNTGATIRAKGPIDINSDTMINLNAPVINIGVPINGLLPASSINVQATTPPGLITLASMAKAELVYAGRLVSVGKDHAITTGGVFTNYTIGNANYLANGIMNIVTDAQCTLAVGGLLNMAAGGSINMASTGKIAVSAAPTIEKSLTGPISLPSVASFIIME